MEGPVRRLSRDSLLAQRKGLSLDVELVDCGVDSALQMIGIGEGLMGEMAAL
jgi:hypothetical protein